MGWAGTGGTGGMLVGMGPPTGAAAGAGGAGGGGVSAAGGGAAAAVVLAAPAETQSELKPPQHSSTRL